jgi:hypothetical protein
VTVHQAGTTHVAASVFRLGYIGIMTRKERVISVMTTFNVTHVYPAAAAAGIAGSSQRAAPDRAGGTVRWPERRVGPVFYRPTV